MASASTSLESGSQVLAPASTLPASPTTVPEPAAAPEPVPVPPQVERPAPGTFRFMPDGVKWTWCSKPNPGRPERHPVLVLPSQDLDSTLVKVVFTTTKDVVGYCKGRKAREWACNYAPIKGQLHPWRDAIPLAQGCVGFLLPTSVNVTTVYTVAWSELEDLSFVNPGMLAPCLDSEGLRQVMDYVEHPRADEHTEFKIIPPQLRKFISPAPLCPAPVCSQGFAPPAGYAPMPVPLVVPVFVPGPVQVYVPPFLRFPPPAVQFNHPVWSAGTWR